MKYFTIKELSKTDTGLPNNPDPQSVQRLTNLVDKLLDPIRRRYGKAIYVNSGYRSEAVNSHPNVKGAVNSQHLKGEAADITGGNREENMRLFAIIASSGLEFDQLIDERNYQWIHVSLKYQGTNRKQILHLK